VNVERRTDKAGPVTLTCSQCGVEIDCCEFCDGRDCASAICYGCLNVALGQAMQQPHAHGG
jgi:hypothetical protein